MSNVVDKVLKLRDVCDVKTLRKTMMFDEGDDEWNQLVACEDLVLILSSPTRQGE